MMTHYFSNSTGEGFPPELDAISASVKTVVPPLHHDKSTFQDHSWMILNSGDQIQMIYFHEVRFSFLFFGEE